MKKKIMMYAILLPVMFFAISYHVTAQEPTTGTYEDNARIDSLAKAYGQQEAAEAAKDERRKNSDNLSDLKSEKNETKAKAKEAQRIEGEANDAARESKIAYRQEKKAQRAREQADKQSRKAAKARTKSNKN